MSIRKKAERAPDKKKLTDIAESIMKIAQPELKSKEAKGLLLDTLLRLKEVSEHLISQSKSFS